MGPSLQWPRVRSGPCGLITMATNARLVWAMASDRRLPGHQLLSRVPQATGGPSWATVLAAVAPRVPLIAIRSNTDALIGMFTAGTLMPAITYTGIPGRCSSTSPSRAVSGPSRATSSWAADSGWMSRAPWYGLAYKMLVLLGPGHLPRRPGDTRSSWSARDDRSAWCGR